VTHAIHVSSLTKVFPDGTRAVDGIELSIDSGEIFGLLGPNGAGKTTTVRMMAGLLGATSGQVFLDGSEMTPARTDARLLIGVCPQENVMWDDLTVGESIRFMGRLYSIPTEDIHLRSAVLLEELTLSTKENTLVRHLSGGMKRRLNLLLGLVHDPKILFMDEPSAGLDPQTRLLLWDFIEELADEKKKTILLTTHYMEEADRLCNRLAIMDRGKVLVTDTSESLKAKHGGGDVVTLLVRGIGSTQAGGAEAPAPQGPDRQEIVARVAAVAGIDKMRWEGNRLAFVLPGTVAENAETLQKALRAVASSGAHVDDMRVHRPTLEDVFIRLTGRRLREEAEGA
jgi:ABC-2 type transport system ATP-binding protein